MPTYKTLYFFFTLLVLGTFFAAFSIFSASALAALMRARILSAESCGTNSPLNALANIDWVKLSTRFLALAKFFSNVSAKKKKC